MENKKYHIVGTVTAHFSELIPALQGKVCISYRI
jgi:hypothetical protein